MFHESFFERRRCLSCDWQIKERSKKPRLSPSMGIRLLVSLPGWDFDWSGYVRVDIFTREHTQKMAFTRRCLVAPTSFMKPSTTSPRLLLEKFPNFLPWLSTCLLHWQPHLLPLSCLCCWWHDWPSGVRTPRHRLFVDRHPGARSRDSYLSFRLYFMLYS